MSELSVNHLLGIKYLNKEDIKLIFETTDHFKEVINRPIKKVPSLRDITIANLFFENSTRTKLSFELAEKRLSADVINFSASQSSVKKGETLIDTVNNILSMKVDMVVMRHPNPGASVFLSNHVNASIINAGDGAHEHPTQALLDSYSIRERLSDVKGKKVVIVGDILHSRVALSNIFALKTQGAQVMVCGPKTLIPKYIDKLGVIVETNLRKALNWCDVANKYQLPFCETSAKTSQNVNELFDRSDALHSVTLFCSVLSNFGRMSRSSFFSSETSAAAARVASIQYCSCLYSEINHLSCCLSASDSCSLSALADVMSDFIACDSVSH